MKNLMPSWQIVVIIIFFFFFGMGGSCVEEVIPEVRCTDLTNNWTVSEQNHPTEFKQNDLVFINEEIGFSVGFGGTILKTLNSGVSWNVLTDRNSINKLTELKLSSVYFFNDNYGFIGGERKDFGDEDELLLGAIFIKTYDGGNSWSKKYFENIQKFHDLYFSDSLHGISLTSIEDGDNNFVKMILKTDDAGENWEEISTPGIYLNSNKIIQTPSSLYVLAKDENNNSISAISNDNGLNWGIKQLPEKECNRIVMINDQVGFVTCGNSFIVERVYKTENRGDSWKLIEESPINEYSIVHFASEQQGVVINSIFEQENVGGETLFTLESFDISETFDGGNSWSTVMGDRQCGFEGVSFHLDNSTFFIMGEKFTKFHIN